MTLSRRNLLSAAGAGLVPMMPGLNVAFGASGAPTNTVVFLFLRFGMDGLQMLAPADEAGRGRSRGEGRTAGPDRESFRRLPQAAPGAG
jgi:uncharacterized protein (DUF1501 family)